MSPTEYALTQLRALWLYLRLLFWPAGQNVDWDLRLSSALDVPTALAGAALLALLAGVAWLLRRARTATPPAAAAARLTALGVIWFLVALAPTSSFMPLSDTFNEHRPYLAAWGIALAVVAASRLALARLPAGAGRAAGAAAALVAAAALGWATHQRNAVWRSHRALWEDAARKSPGKPRPHVNLGQALGDQGDHEGALAEYRRAAALDDPPMPDYLRALLHQNTSASLGALGRYPESMAEAREGLRVEPRNLRLLQNLALSALRAGDVPEARRAAERAVAAWPRSPQARVTLGDALAAAGELGPAAGEYEQAAALDRRGLEPVVRAARTRERLGEAGAACGLWLEVGRRSRTEVQRSAAAAKARELGCAR